MMDNKTAFGVLAGIAGVLIIVLLFSNQAVSDDILIISGGGSSNTTETNIFVSTPITKNATNGNVLIACPTCTTDNETWILLANVSATNGATSLATSNFTSYKYYQIQFKIITQSGVSVWNMRFSGDSANNYSYRHCVSFGSCSSATATSSISLVMSLGSGVTFFDFYCSQTGNILHQKMCYGNGLENDNPPEGFENFSMWSNTANDLVSVSLQRTSGTGTLTTASNLQVFGHN